ncbi:MAG TPA: DUF6798 domain-containing protein [Tepidisphaeraceae bacterium]|nr:DUF6798 domain-containing protein [Tepidisphaeraceae bacterium]
MTFRQSFLPLCLGSAITLMVYGYQFGRSNHTAYLLDALRLSEPPVLANDWFTTQTLQYHVAFTRITEVLMKLHIVAPAFAVFYVALVVLFHIAWRGIIGQLGGTDRAYLASVALYYLSAAGTALGMYQFFQDSSLLPSNIANVALLWGLYFWIAGRYRTAGLCLGIAGIFHLNHALVGILLWLVLCASLPLAPSRKNLPAYFFALVPSAINIALAARLKLSRSGAMPFDQFLELYVRLRHPHHYDPSSWPLGIWIAFGWTIIPGLSLLRGQWRRIFIFFLGLNLVALIGAGFWYFSETLVQMSLYRFSIDVQILGCSALAVWIEAAPSRKRLVGFGGAAGCIAMIAVCAVRGPFYGFFKNTDDDSDYLAACQWVATNTPVDAVCVVPPDEQSMRLMGRRAIIVNFKSVPQLSAELLEWNRRLCDVLKVDRLRDDSHNFEQTLVYIRKRYNELSTEQLTQTAHQYGARLIVGTHELDFPDSQLIFTSAGRRYFVYDLSR